MPHRFSSPAIADAESSSERSLFDQPMGDAATLHPAGLTPEDVDAIRCQAIVLEVFMDIELDCDALVAFACQQGWYCAGEYAGAQSAGVILELNSIDVTRYERANVYDLAHELAQGHMVILGAEPSSDSTTRRPNSELHSAFRVLQIDTTNPHDVYVLIQDPVTGSQIARYPLGQFLSYWRDRHFFIVATTKPTPIWAKGMVNFDYSRGCIDSIMGKSFAEFRSYEAYPRSWRASILPDAAYKTNNACESLNAPAGTAINDALWAIEAQELAMHLQNPVVNI